jgi:hypothetical protein
MLDIIGQSNSMAKSAHGVACSLYHRLRHRFGISVTENTRALLSNSEWISPNSDTANSNDAPSESSFDAVLPPHPTHDLFFDHISSTPIPFMDTPNFLSLDPFAINVTDNWYFEGTFSDASFWGVMNEFNH